MSTKLQPLADWIVAEQLEAATKTASGLYLPENAAEKPKVAKVLKELRTGKEEEFKMRKEPLTTETSLKITCA